MDGDSYVPAQYAKAGGIAEMDMRGLAKSHDKSAIPNRDPHHPSGGKRKRSEPQARGTRFDCVERGCDALAVLTAVSLFPPGRGACSNGRGRRRWCGSCRGERAGAQAARVRQRVGLRVAATMEGVLWPRLLHRRASATATGRLGREDGGEREEALHTSVGCGAQAGGERQGDGRARAPSRREEAQGRKPAEERGGPAGAWWLGVFLSSLVLISVLVADNQRQDNQEAEQEAGIKAHRRGKTGLSNGCIALAAQRKVI